MRTLLWPSDLLGLTYSPSYHHSSSSVYTTYCYHHDQQRKEEERLTDSCWFFRSVIWFLGTDCYMAALTMGWDTVAGGRVPQVTQQLRSHNKVNNNVDVITMKRIPMWEWQQQQKRENYNPFRNRKITHSLNKKLRKLIAPLWSKLARLGSRQKDQ